MSARAPRPVRRFVLVTIILPAILIGVSLVVQALLLPSLPDPVAIHWGISGTPDRFGSAPGIMVLTALVGFGVPLLIGLSALGGLRRGDRGPSYRLLGATGLGLAALMGVLGTASLAMQSGLADAADGPRVFGALIAAFASAAAAGVIGWLLQPHEPYRATVLPAGQVDLAVDEHAVWLQSVHLARSATLVIGLALLMLVALSAASFLFAPPAVVVVLVVVSVVLAALLATTAGFHVRVDAQGLSVISVMGFPRMHVPLADVARVEAVDVRPMGEFGGWGVRWAPNGGFGVVLKSGPGIRVTRRSGKTFTVTVDDAATGAALLGALAARVG